MSGGWPFMNARPAAISCRPRPGRPRWTGTSPWESGYFSASCPDLPRRYARLPQTHGVLPLATGFFVVGLVVVEVAPGAPAPEVPIVHIGGIVVGVSDGELHP